MKKLANLDEKMPSMDLDKPDTLPSFREILRMIGNVKSDTADNARRTVRILTKVRDKSTHDLLIENDDLGFIEKRFEENAMGLTAWAQGQVLEMLDNAEKVGKA